MKALGTTESDFIDGLLAQLANVATKGRAVDERGLNFMLAVVKGIEPRDQVEAMLAAQMAAVHNATMTFARRLAHVENIPQQDSAERAFNKLARTFAEPFDRCASRVTGADTIRRGRALYLRASKAHASQQVRRNPTIENRQPANHPPITHLHFYTASTHC